MSIPGVKKIALTAFCTFFMMSLVVNTSLVFAKNHTSIILDTDLSSDVDDVGAVAVLHALADKGEAKILAMMVSSGDPWSVPCLDALNTWFGRPDIPLGMVKGKRVIHASTYTKNIAEEFTHDSKSGNDALDAVQLYRKILASQPDQSVILVTVGYLTNLRNLLASKADAASSLDGTTLVREKVKKLVCMGGEYPEGREWNFYQDAAAAEKVISDWPTPIIFSGFEVGRDVLTGAGMRGSKTPNPVRRSYELYNGLKNRPSWDQVTVLYAVRNRQSSIADKWFERKYGLNIVSPDGSNKWRASADNSQSYLHRKIPVSVLAEQIESLMLSPPTPR